ncbi:MAG: NADPH:quinone oxidoreductase family protein [Actinomycetota bacterium]
MRRWQLNGWGEPKQVMELVEVDAPEAKAGQVVIDVRAVGLNYPDLLQIKGSYQAKPPLPYTPGAEIGGVISEVGVGVTQWQVGDRVVWMGRNGLADKTVAPADGPLRIADSLPFDKAVSIPTNYGTGLFALKDRACLRPGETVLVHAGAGGVGSAAIQMANAMGATVFATAGGPEKKAVCERLGAAAAIDYLSEDFVERVKELTDGRGVDVIYDPVGGDTFDRSRKVIGWDGRILPIGFTSGRIADAPTNHILLKNYSVVGVHYGAAVARDPMLAVRNMELLCRWYDEGKIDPLVMRHVPLEEAAQAFEDLGTRNSWGKLVITP